MIFCSQFAPAGWYSKFPEETIADAILDRIAHDSYTIEIRGAANTAKNPCVLYTVSAASNGSNIHKAIMFHESFPKKQQQPI